MAKETRLDRAREIRASNGVLATPDPYVYNVESQTGNGRYSVRTVRHPLGAHCHCYDAGKGFTCKHVLAAHLEAAHWHASACLELAEGHTMLKPLEFALCNVRDHISGVAEMSTQQLEGSLQGAPKIFQGHIDAIVRLLRVTTGMHRAQQEQLSASQAMDELFDDDPCDSALPTDYTRGRGNLFKS